MAALPFDTLDYARKLEAAGVPAAQAEVQARALNEALAGSVATKVDIANLGADIANLELRMDARFEQVDARFQQVDARFEQLRTELELKLGGKIETLQWMFGVLVAMNAATLIRLFLEH
jgi:hypothetical protein